jgi:hypothetical protein
MSCTGGAGSPRLGTYPARGPHMTALPTSASRPAAYSRNWLGQMSGDDGKSVWDRRVSPATAPSR